MLDRREPTAQQMKAVANPMRLRILSLCEGAELTNKQLADRLARDPSTTLHHVRLLEAAGLIEAAGIRKGPSGAYEKPYHSTGLARRLSFALPTSDDERLPMLDAFSEELREAGHTSVAQLTTFHLHLGETDLEEFIEQYLHLLAAWRQSDDVRAESGEPRYGGVVVVHRMADDKRMAGGKRESEDA